MTAPNPTRLATLTAGSTDALGARIHALAQCRQTRPIEKHRHCERGRQRHHGDQHRRIRRAVATVADLRRMRDANNSAKVYSIVGKE